MENFKPKSKGKYEKEFLYAKKDKNKEKKAFKKYDTNKERFLNYTEYENSEFIAKYPYKL